MKISIAIVFSLLGLLFSSGAWAVEKDSFYYLGLRQAKANVTSAWRTLRQDCAKADTLLRIVKRSNRRTKRAMRRYGRDVVSYGSGYIVGLFKAFEPIANQCRNKCEKIGKMVGIEAAEIYCEMAEIIGGIPEFVGYDDIPNYICGNAFVMSCEANFDIRASDRCPNYTRGPAFESYYASDQRGCCAYDPNPDN